MESAAEKKLDALEQTIKSLRKQRNQYLQSLEAAQVDAKKQNERFSRLEEQLKKERETNHRLERHLQSLGVEVNRSGNIGSLLDAEVGDGLELEDLRLNSTNIAPPTTSIKVEDTNTALPPPFVKKKLTNTCATGSDAEDNKASLVKIKKGKKNENIWLLPPDVRTRYLDGFPQFSVDPEPPHVGVGRYALNKAYGSATVAMSWSHKDDTHHFLFPSHEWNPDMPRGPGETGLLLEMGAMYCDGIVRTLFYKLQDGKKSPVLLGYAGEYVCREAGKLWKEEYASLSDVCKNTRARNMLNDRQGGWINAKARIALRKKLKREPTEGEVTAEHPKLMVAGPYAEDYLTALDITEAFVKGDEYLVVTRMECVQYDHDKAVEFNAVQRRYEEMKRDQPRTSKSKNINAKRTRTQQNGFSDSDIEIETVQPTKRVRARASKGQVLPPAAGTLASSRKLRIKVKGASVQNNDMLDDITDDDDIYVASD